MKRILVVDDDESVREALAAFLSQEGHEVDTASDGVEALARLDHDRYDLILTDLQMPGMDGPAFYEALRTRYHFPVRFTTTLPRVVFMTGTAREHVEFLKGTTEPILEKPFDLKVVRQVVSVLLAGQRGAPDGPAEPARSERDPHGALRATSVRGAPAGRGIMTTRVGGAAAGWPASGSHRRR
jgi:CheY-like chemotaxis protein